MARMNIRERVMVGIIATSLALSVMAPSCDPVRHDRIVAVEEDDPRWDCRTMGNRICGPETGESR